MNNVIKTETSRLGNPVVMFSRVFLGQKEYCVTCYEGDKCLYSAIEDSFSAIETEFNVAIRDY